MTLIRYPYDDRRRRQQMPRVVIDLDVFAPGADRLAVILQVRS